MKRFLYIASLALFLQASTAVAQNNAPKGWSAGALAGWGFNDAYSLGLGGRVGYTLPANVYVGGTAVFNLGTSSTVTFFNSSLTTRISSLYFGAEGGYDFGFDKFTVRPSAILGYLSVNVSTTGTSILGTASASAAGSTFVFSPGVMGQIEDLIGKRTFIGADLRFHIGDGYGVATLYGSFGFRF